MICQHSACICSLHTSHDTGFPFTCNMLLQGLQTHISVALPCCSDKWALRTQIRMQ